MRIGGPSNPHRAVAARFPGSPGMCPDCSFFPWEMPQRNFGNFPPLCLCSTDTLIQTSPYWNSSLSPALVCPQFLTAAIPAAASRWNWESWAGLTGGISCLGQGLCSACAWFGTRSHFVLFNGVEKNPSCECLRWQELHFCQGWTGTSCTDTRTLLVPAP